MSETRLQQALREIPPVDRLLEDPSLATLRCLGTPDRDGPDRRLAPGGGSGPPGSHGAPGLHGTPGSRGPRRQEVSRNAFARGLREALDALRDRVRREAWSAEAVRAHFTGGGFAASLRGTLLARTRSAYRHAVNATGVVLHTGLGRAPLPPAARRALARELRGYSVVEIDPASGDRSRREAEVVHRLCAMTGAQAGIVVNNNAAAVHLSLHANLRGREVVVSRGELVEIGGGFRVPDVLRAGGVTLVEVGTTNRTRLADYEAAMGPATGALLKVHTSNFRVVGFTGGVGIAELSSLARREGVALFADLGSGMLDTWPGDAFPGEPRIRQALEGGADVVTFSGDKLLGGPQCGIALGGREWIERMRRDTFFRVLRVGKMTLVALEACVRLWEDPESLPAELPVARMLLADPRVLRRRARALARRLGDACGGRFRIEVAGGDSQAGSGSLPGVEIPSAVVRVIPVGAGEGFVGEGRAAGEVPEAGNAAVAGAGDSPDVSGAAAGTGGSAADALARRLRLGDPPVFTRVHRGAVQLDLRTVLPGEEREIAAAFRAVAGGDAAAGD